MRGQGLQANPEGKVRELQPVVRGINPWFKGVLLPPYVTNREVYGPCGVLDPYITNLGRWGMWLVGFGLSFSLGIGVQSILVQVPLNLRTQTFS